MLGQEVVPGEFVGEGSAFDCGSAFKTLVEIVERQGVVEEHIASIVPAMRLASLPGAERRKTLARPNSSEKCIAASELTSEFGVSARKYPIPPRSMFSIACSDSTLT